MNYHNTVSYGDAPDGSEGGYDAHGNYIIPAAMMEIVELREAITEANEAMRDGSDSTAWAILVAALAGKEPRD